MRPSDPSVGEIIVRAILLVGLGYVALMFLSMMAPAGG